jgi:2-polyprenyl-3-methyl-5-hydroxy-6-metoxy-1,4-benzoquinol methylase
MQQIMRELDEARAMLAAIKPPIDELDDAPLFPSGGEQGYFDSYAQIGIHREMIGDHVRTDTYRKFLECSGACAGKRVLDVGCGTGVLSMFAARGGASSVVGIDACSIAAIAEKNVAENGMQQCVRILQTKVEDAVLDAGSFDMIVSEWMGYFLLYESMMDSVIHARNKFLKQGGSVQPSRCTIVIAGAVLGSLAFDWDHVYGLKMRAMREVEAANMGKEAVVAVLDGTSIVTDECTIWELDALHCSVSDLEFSRPFCTVARWNTKVDGIAAWFDTFFEVDGQQKAFFSTSPSSTPTHWKQTFFYFPCGPVTVRCRFCFACIFLAAPLIFMFSQKCCISHTRLLQLMSSSSSSPANLSKAAWSSAGRKNSLVT